MTLSRLIGIASAAIALLGTPSHADKIAFWDASCTPTMTVQKKSCRVTTYYTCPGIQAGAILFVTYDHDGRQSDVLRDAEWQFQKDFYVPKASVRNVGVISQAYSLSKLIEEGQTIYDYTIVGPFATSSRFAGREWLTGETVVIDGIEFLETGVESSMYRESGEVALTTTGKDLVSKDLSATFVGARTTIYASGKTEERDRSPVSFAFPGEEGFEATTPINDCNPQTSALEGEQSEDDHVES